MLVTVKGIDIYVNNSNAYNYRPNQSVVLSSFNGEYRILDKPMILEKMKAPGKDLVYGYLDDSDWLCELILKTAQELPKVKKKIK